MADRSKSPVPNTRDRVAPSRHGSKSSVKEFLAQVAQTPAPVPTGDRGRLIFALDATMSREPTWDMACQIQAEMFSETSALGGLDIQLSYFRGFNEFHAGNWVSEPAVLLKQMTGIQCRGGYTQIERVFRHAIDETKERRVSALVFIGDCMEETVDSVCAAGGELGLLGVPAFLFHEGDNGQAERTFKELARLTGGAYCHFDRASASVLRDLLNAVAVYAAGGRKALADYGKQKGGNVLRIAQQVK